MRSIDFHHHLMGGEDYLEQLRKTMTDLGIEKVCLSGLGIGKDSKIVAGDYGAFNLGNLAYDNEAVLKAYNLYPEQIIPFGVIRLGKDQASMVGELKAQGFRGLKITRPPADYDADAFLPIYRETEKQKLPILFHTGMILPTPYDQEDDVSSERMRPMKLDRIARLFPDLAMVLAHMGSPWLQEAAAMARFHPNVYLDITAAAKGWRSQVSPEEFKRLLYWEGSFSKLVFGTDVLPKDMAAALEEQRNLLVALKLDNNLMESFFSGNALRLMGGEND